MEREKGVSPNEVTIASVLPACANLGALEVGQRIEDYARRKGYFINMFVCNGILEMYSRCGRIDMAKRVFDEIGCKRNVCSWNSIIMGLAVHGKCNEALKLFQEMLSEGAAPDDVTFVGGQWDGVAKLWKLMKGGRITKAAGYSFIEEGGKIHKFIVEDRTHPQSFEIYALLDEVSTRVKHIGNATDLDSIIDESC
ncbi:hypothetical protein Acr_07g0003910 [Actinidia rufa]|uniref:Tetratricopeptide repeat (TPR)-like superfamily protein n=1 Tax=Actinidia rufa TaxID=165716 RepID=A0A7J0EUM8_9ERIC|nr:hypothetical protein Acr_07g0003910 [Actinidia rufa]